MPHSMVHHMDGTARGGCTADRWPALYSLMECVLLTLYSKYDATMFQTPAIHSAIIMPYAYTWHGGHVEVVMHAGTV